MPRSSFRRPSPATIIALIALFVALGGPAHASRLIRGSQIKSSTLTGRHIKNGSLHTVDLAASSARSLRATPAGSVDSTSVRDGSLTGGDIADFSIGNRDIAPGSIGPLKITANAVASATVLDGSLKATDVARFAGHFTADLASVPPQSCVGFQPEGLATQAANVTLAGDVILGTPPASWPDGLTFTIHPARGSANQIRVVACNPTAVAIDPPDGLFRYAVLYLPV